MARVTVEDCVLKVPNRFDLVMLAAQRARDISSGAQLTLERDKDKNPVIALREIAEETVDLTILADALVKGHQRQIEFDEPEEEAADFELPQVPGELTAQPAGPEETPEAPGPEVDAASDKPAEQSAGPDETAGESAEESAGPDETAGESAEESAGPDKPAEKSAEESAGPDKPAEKSAGLDETAGKLEAGALEDEPK